MWTRAGNFYPRPPRGGRLASSSSTSVSKSFLSTPSARRATRNHAGGNHDKRISIHALREEGDHLCKRALRGAGDFYPRPPRGGRPPALRRSFRTLRFLSTPSARRATCQTVVFALILHHFYPRPPRGGRQNLACKLSHYREFLSTPSARRATALTVLSARL